MTTPDELNRAIEMVKATSANIRQKATPDQFGDDLANAYARQADAFDLLLSERAELLATVERMRGALEFYADRKLYAGNDTSRWTAAGDDEGRTARAALTTGEGK